MSSSGRSNEGFPHSQFLRSAYVAGTTARNELANAGERLLSCGQFALVLFWLNFLPMHIMRQDERSFIQRGYVGSLLFRNPHAVKGTVNEKERDQKEEDANASLERGVGHGYGDFHGEQAEESGEFDHRVHRHR